MTSSQLTSMSSSAGFSQTTCTNIFMKTLLPDLMLASCQLTPGLERQKTQKQGQVMPPA